VDRLKLLVLSLLLTVSVGTAAADPTPYRIAVILPLTGQVASLGNYVKNGLDLALAELPAEQRSKIEVTYEDDQFNPTQTISSYRNLKSGSGVDALFVLGSPPANAIGPITEHDKTILMAIGASDPSIAVGKKYSFVHWVTPPVLGEKLAEELVKRNFHSVAFVTAQASGTVADTDAAVAALQKNGRGNTVVYYEKFPKELTDYRSALLQMKSKNADCVVAALFPGALSAFAKQFRENKLSAQLAGMETFEDDDEVKASQGSLIGGWYVNASDGTSEFVSLYKKNYGSHPGWASANGYDVIKMFAAGISAVGPDNDKLRDYFNSLRDFRGASGVFSASGDNRFTLPAAVKIVTSTGYQLVK